MCKPNGLDNLSHRKKIIYAAVSSLLAIAGSAAQAQQRSESATATVDDLQEVVVVGSQIKGRITEAVPVTLITEDDLQSIGAVSGDDLFRSVPQFADTNFNTSNSAQTTNAARGDVGSADLRTLGIGNTLVLINGRRTVNHPTSQALTNTNSVPVLTYNTNAIAGTGLSRVEVLLDGGAALYGSDAVAGVVNTVTKRAQDGLNVSVQYGGAESTHLREFQLNLSGGKNFSWGNISGTFEYTDREAMLAEDSTLTAFDDRRALFANYPNYAALTGSDTRNTRGVWPNLFTNGQVRAGTTALTSTAGAFHIRPTSFGSCTRDLGNGICLVNTALPTTGVFRDLRYDTSRGTSVLPEVTRSNTFLTGERELTDSLTLFGELGFYQASSFRLQPAVINLFQIWVPATNYWNPFGPTTLPNGQANPNRLPGLTNVSTAGIPVRIDNYRFADAGPQYVDVDNYQARVLVGIKGKKLGFEWNSAFVYAEAEASDISNNVNTTALQKNLALSSPDAYNMFNGGCLNDPTYGDCTPSSQTAIDAIKMSLRRDTRTTFTMVDFKASRTDLATWRPGDIGVAFGAEVRKETQRDDRDSNVDGSIPFVDAVTGAVNLSNVAAVSPNPDSGGSRDVSAAYLEFAVPLVSGDMNIPLVRNLETQVAGRVENYSDFGDVAKPKFALAWDIVSGLRVRASYSQGFRAPNLETTTVPLISRNTTNQDYVKCEVDVRAKRIASFATCARSLSFQRRIAGNPDLEPEESENKSVGLVFEPKFLPESLGGWTMTVDYWDIRQKGIVGILGPEGTIALDYLARLNGSTNPNVVRAPANADDTAFFGSSGLAPAGQILAIDDKYVNLQPQKVRGLDIALVWSLDDTPIGDFSVKLNATKMLEFQRDPGPVIEGLLEARAKGQINAATALPEGKDLIRQGGRPEWRGTGSITWSKGGFQIGTFHQYTSDYDEIGFLDATGVPWLVRSQLTHNLYLQYKTDKSLGMFGDTRIRMGARDITNEGPPLTSGGYDGFLSRPYGRYFYMSLSKNFK
jgi:iron complex outermembrane receptor protein